MSDIMMTLHDIYILLCTSGTDRTLLRRIMTAGREAEANIKMHAGGNGHLTYEKGTDRIIINAIDHGPGIPDIESAMKVGWSTKRDRPHQGGLGLPIIKDMCDHLDIETSERGTTLTMIFDLYGEKK